MDEQAETRPFTRSTRARRKPLCVETFRQEGREEGLPQIAQLFRVIAFSEEIHGERALGCSRRSKTLKRI